MAAERRGNPDPLERFYDAEFSDQGRWLNLTQTILLVILICAIIVTVLQVTGPGTHLPSWR